MNDSAATSRIPGFDTLRAIAVTAVIAGHVLSLPGGFIGVDIFFVISGYVITWTLFTDWTSGELSLCRFYVRRLRRIIPPLLGVSVFTFLLAKYYFLNPEDYENFKFSYFYQAFFAQNFFFLQYASNYFKNLYESNFNIHLWSIAIEEQFYTVYPVVFVAVLSLWRSKSARLKPAAILGLSWLSLVAFGILTYQLFLDEGWFWTVKATPFPKYYLIQHRAWELLAGCAAFAVHHHLVNGRFVDRVILSHVRTLEHVLLFTLLVSVFLIRPTHAWPGAITLIPVLATSLLMIATHLRFSRQDTNRLMDWAPAAALGRASYSVYLYHWPLYAALVYANYRFGQNLSDYALYVLLLGIFALGSYALIESPSRRLTGFGALCVTLIFPSFHFYVFLSEPRQLPPESWMARHQDSGRLSRPCSTCLSPARVEGRFLVLWGDSHGRALNESLENFTTKHGLNLVILKCSPARVDECGPESLATAKTLAVQPGFQAFILASRWSYLLNSQSGEAREASLVDFERAVRAVAEAFPDKKIILLREPPNFEFHPKKEAYLQGLALRWGSGHNKAKSLDEHRREKAAVDRILDRYLTGRPNVFTIDPALRLCPARECQWRDAGGFLYFDDNHLSVHGAELIGREISAALGAAYAANRR